MMRGEYYAKALELEQEHIRCIIASTGSLQEAAMVLGIDAATLYRKRKRYKMDA